MELKLDLLSAGGNSLVEFRYDVEHAIVVKIVDSEIKSTKIDKNTTKRDKVYTVQSVLFSASGIVYGLNYRQIGYNLFPISAEQYENINHQIRVEFIRKNTAGLNV